MNIRQRLSEYVGAQKKVMLVRIWPSEEVHHGFVFGIGKCWTLLWRFTDFSANGFELLRTEHIREFRSGRYERHWEKMLRAEGKLESWPTLHLPLDDTVAIVQALEHSDGFVEIKLEAAELEESREGEQTYFIGRILSHNDDSLRFAHFDGEGIWNERSHHIRFQDITCMRFRTNYAQTFGKYVSGAFPPE